MQFLPVIYSGANKFLDRIFSEFINTYLITIGNCDEVLDILVKDKDWLRIVFGKEKVTKFNVAGFFCHLLATEILSFRFVGGKNVRLVVSRDKDDVKLYSNPVQWEGAEFQTSGC